MAHLYARDERYRSPLPGGPFSIDSRGMSARDITDAIQHAQYGIQPPEFNYGPAAPIRPRSPYTPGPLRFEDVGSGYNHDLHVHELVRKTNLAVSLANHNISPRAQYTQVHPMMCLDGKFPVDFQMPKTVESVKLLDSTQLDRILQEYKLPFDTRTVLAATASSTRSVGESMSSSRLRQAKLHILFEHLGANRIIEQERLKRSGLI